MKEQTMVEHVILWKLKEEIENRSAVKSGIKTALEGCAVRSAHVEMANTKVCPFIRTRLCRGFEV